MPDTTVQRQTSNLDLTILHCLNCEEYLNMYLIRQIFIQLSKLCFSNTDFFKQSMNHFPEGMETYTYSDVLLDSSNVNNISVVDVVGDYSFGDNAAAMDFFKDNQKPAVFVALGDANFSSYNVTQDVIDSNLQDGSTVHSLIASQQLLFSCYSLTYVEASIMSHILSSFLMGIRKKLNPLFIKPYSLSKISSPKCVDFSNMNKMYHSDIVLDINYTFKWINKPEGVLLAGASLDFERNA